MTTTPLNPGLYRLHRVFFLAFAAFAVIMILIGLLTIFRGGEDAAIGLVGLGLLPIGIAHWYAAKGAKDGKSYGVVISRIIGTLWLIGFPIAAKNGTTNFYSPRGKRMFYNPKKGRGIFGGKDGSFCGVLARVNGELSLALTERGAKILLLSE